MSAKTEAGRRIDTMMLEKDERILELEAKVQEHEKYKSFYDSAKRDAIEKGSIVKKEGE